MTMKNETFLLQFIHRNKFDVGLNVFDLSLAVFYLFENPFVMPVFLTEISVNADPLS